MRCEGIVRDLPVRPRPAAQDAEHTFPEHPWLSTADGRAALKRVLQVRGQGRWDPRHVPCSTRLL